MRFGQVRLLVDRAAIVRDRFVEFVSRQPQSAEPRVSLGETGTKRQGLPEDADGVVGASKTFKLIRQRVCRVGVAPQIDRLSAGADGGVEIALILQNGGDAVVRGGGGWIVGR